MYVVAILALVACGGGFAEETSASIKKEIAKLEKSKSKALKDNPCVVYVEVDNPSINVKKTMDRQGGKYPKGVTMINRTFFCPIHKTSSPCLRYDRADRWCKKAQIAKSQWDSLRAGIEKTEQCLQKVESLESQLEELKDRLDEIKKEESEAKRKQGM